MEIGASGFHIRFVAEAMVGKSTLPNRELRGKAVREAAFDKTNRSFERDGLWREDEMDVVGHDYEGVEFVMAQVAIVLESFDEEVAVGDGPGRGGDDCRSRW